MIQKDRMRIGQVGTNEGLSILMLLSLVIGLNAPPEAVLCLGSHGHVAVELAHGSCAQSVRTHEAESAEHCAGFSSCREANCRGCTDIPLPGGLYSNDGASSGSKNGCVRSISVLCVMPASADEAAPLIVQVPAGLSVGYSVLLRSIVLQV